MSLQEERRGKPETETEGRRPGDNGSRRWRDAATAREHHEPQKLEEAERILILDSGLQNWERITWYHLKPPGVSSFVTAAGDTHTPAFDLSLT